MKVGFQNIQTTRVTSRSPFAVNFVTTMTKGYVEIVKKKGMSIAVTPADNQSSVEEANLALSRWVKTSVRHSLVERPLNNARGSWSAKSVRLGYLSAE